MIVTSVATTERIRFYKFRSMSLIMTILAPLICGNLMALIMLLVAISQGRSWLFTAIDDLNRPLAILSAVVMLLFLFWLSANKVRSKIRRNLKDLYREKSYDQAAYESFDNALMTVSIGLGISKPPLDVLGIPTVNSITFRESKRPHVGITAEALRAGFSRFEKEALMAHEVAHIALGDYFLASRSAAFEYAGYGCGLLLLLQAVLLLIAVNVYLPLFLLPLFLPLMVVLADKKLIGKKRDLYRCNDLLTDTIAAKLVSDPGCLKNIIEKLWTFSETTSAVIPKTAHFQEYLFLRRPLASGPIKMVTYKDSSSGKEGNNFKKGMSKVTKIYWIPGKEKSETWIAYETVQSRIHNLKAIEMGQWSELEKPLRRQKTHSIMVMAGAGLLIAASIISLFIPWHGKTLWHHATNNIVWKMLTNW